MDEKFLDNVIRDHFGKDSWNYLHTKAAVYYMKHLIKNEGGNPKVLITAIYLHDIGYISNKNLTLKERLKRKKNHMRIGAKESMKILSKRDYTNKELYKIIHLILFHDKLKLLKTKDEIMMMEADTLGQIDFKRVKPSFNKKELRIYLENHLLKERLPRFKTKTGKRIIKRLIKNINQKIN